MITPILCQAGEYPQLDIEGLTDTQATTLLRELRATFVRFIRVKRLPLSGRAHNVLMRAELIFVGDILDIPSRKLATMRGLGEMVRAEVRSVVMEQCFLPLPNWE